MWWFVRVDNRGEGGRVVVVVCKREGLIGDGGKIHYIVYIKY